MRRFVPALRSGSNNLFRTVRAMSVINPLPVGKADVVFRSVTPEEASKACDFGRAEMIRTFAYLYNKDDFDAYLAEAYTTAKYEEWLKSREYVVYGAFLDPVKAGLLGDAVATDKESDKMVAYVLAGPCDLPLPADELKIDRTVPAGEIKRLYAHPSTFGSGIAEELMRNAMTWLRSGEGNQNRDVYLGVYSENPRAIKFYEKHNFKLCGEYNFRVGSQLDREFIMKNSV